MSFVVHRVSKSAARYTDAGGREKCGYCRFFVAPRACGKVIGPVSPQGWCKYFSRQMVSQGSTLAGGGPPGATLSLDFMSSGNMPPGITFTRASPASYQDASGAIQTAAVDQPRWDYAGGSLRGLLIEEASTNLALRSGDLSDAAWTRDGSAPTVTGNNTVAPDGTLTAARIAFQAVSSAPNHSNLTQTITATAAPYTLSIWLKGVVGGERLYLSITPDGVLYYRVQAILTTAWQRFTVTTPNLTAASWFLILGTDMRDAGQTATAAQSVYATFAQVERSTFPTSYIPTAGATATRAQDQCGISSANMAPWFNATAGTWLAEFIRISNPLPGDLHIVSGPTEGNALQPLTNQGNGCLQTFDGNNWTASVNTITANAVTRGASNWAANTGRACLNGGAMATPTPMLTGFGGLAASGVGFLTTSPTAGSANNMTGVLRRVQYWPRVLTDAEMQQVTT